MSPYKGATVRTVDDDLVRSVYDLRLLLEPEAVHFPSLAYSADP